MIRNADHWHELLKFTATEVMESRTKQRISSEDIHVLILMLSQTSQTFYLILKLLKVLRNWYQEPLIMFMALRIDTDPFVPKY